MNRELARPPPSPEIAWADDDLAAALDTACDLRCPREGDRGGVARVEGWEREEDLRTPQVVGYVKEAAPFSSPRSVDEFERGGEARGEERSRSKKCD